MSTHEKIRVIKAVNIDTPGLCIHAAPAGFPFLLRENESEITILEAPTLFLFSKFLPIRRDPEKIGARFRVVQNSALAAANDLKDWWEFLAHSARSWTDADQEDLECYRDAMLSTFSPHTGRTYRPMTVRRRIISILQFYTWAQVAGLCHTRIHRQAEFGRRAHPRRYEVSEFLQNLGERNEILPRTSHSAWEHVRVLSIEAYQKISSRVGSLPTDAASDSMDCQCRLGLELGINLGLRINEVTGLTVTQIQSLGPPDPDRLALRYLRIDRTKGSKPRKVAVPSWLLAELRHYISHQRLTALRHRRTNVGIFESDALLLNDARARHRSGTPLTDQTLRRRFGDGQIACGFFRNTTKHNPMTGEISELRTTAYRFHDLRHTFAVWLYYAEKLSGNPEPWKTIQSRLGHEYLSTTQNIYLRAAADFEAEVSDVATASLLAGAKSMSWTRA